MTTREKPGLKAKVSAKSAELVKDLNNVRTAILNKQQQMSESEYLRLEPRLFESWVIEKLAENECLLLALSQQITELREEFKILQKSLPRGEKKEKARKNSR